MFFPCRARDARSLPPWQGPAPPLRDFFCAPPTPCPQSPARRRLMMIHARGAAIRLFVCLVTNGMVWVHPDFHGRLALPSFKLDKPTHLPLEIKKILKSEFGKGFGVGDVKVDDIFIEKRNDGCDAIVVKLDKKFGIDSKASKHSFFVPAKYCSKSILHSEDFKILNEIF